MRRVQAGLQHLVGLELVELEIPLGGVDQGRLRDQPDQLGMVDGDAVAGRLPADHLDDTRQGRAREVGQVHRDLGPALDQHPQRLDDSAGRPEEWRTAAAIFLAISTSSVVR